MGGRVDLALTGGGGKLVGILADIIHVWPLEGGKYVDCVTLLWCHTEMPLPHCTMYRKRFLEMRWVGHFLLIVKWQMVADQLANCTFAIAYGRGAGTS